jgi:VIT1/CCC1 family predicted Fe2+/Mn2+ transporter
VRLADRHHLRMPDDVRFLLQRVQPALTGLMDGSLSTLAPLFATALATQEPRIAFLVGAATAVGAAISMAYSEGLSDTGELTGRGRPLARGAITGGATFLGGILHALPFLLPSYHAALTAAAAVVAVEIVAIAWVRHRFYGSRFGASLLHVCVGGAAIVASGIVLGGAA